MLPRADAAHDEPLRDDGERPRPPHRRPSSTAPDAAARPPRPPRADERLQRDEHTDADGHRAGDRHEPAQLHGRARATGGAAAGSNVRRSSPVTARASELHRWAAEPRRAGLRLLRGRRQHGDQPVLRARDRPPAAIPELPRNARLPTLAPARSAASRLRARSDAIIVSSARKAPSPTVVIFGQQQHGRRLDARADRRRRGPGASSGVTRLA